MLTRFVAEKVFSSYLAAKSNIKDEKKSFIIIIVIIV